MPNSVINDPFAQTPPILHEFLSYLENVKARSEKTVDEYFLDLRTFFRYLKSARHMVEPNTPDAEIDIMDVDAKLLSTVTLQDLYGYLHYLTKYRQNEPAARARKASSLHTFFDYIHVKMHYIPNDPTTELEMPSLRRALPKFLTLEQCIDLLNAIDGRHQARDYCIITLLINCGMRLSELVGINLSDIQGRNVRILGKGNKERIIYLNDACMDALEDYLLVRKSTCKVIKNPEDEDALFLSQHGNRLCNRQVELMLDKYMQKIGLAGQGLSPHKLRHTAATMMYQHGNVDIRILQEILGHTNLANTEIYTHVANRQTENALQNSPTATLHRRKRESLPKGTKGVKTSKKQKPTADLTATPPQTSAKAHAAKRKEENSASTTQTPDIAETESSEET